MHPIVRAKIAWFSDEGHALRGVVHIGANDGEEISWYLHRNHRPVLAFEPHPEPFAELQRMYGAPHGVICVNVALGDADGDLVLQVPEDGDTKHSSKYPPVPTDGEPHAWTLVPNATTLAVPLRRFDSWAQETCIDLSPFDVLVVDVQGMELEVLRGMGRCLDGFRYLNIECSERAMYEGEASAQEVIDWLRAQGFEQQTPIETHDDILFLRVREPEPYVHTLPSGMGAEYAIEDHWEPASQAVEAPAPIADDLGYAHAAAAEDADVSPPPLREWARANGWPGVKNFGRVPKAAQDAYAAAFPDVTATRVGAGQ